MLCIYEKLMLIVRQRRWNAWADSVLTFGLSAYFVLCFELHGIPIREEWGWWWYVAQFGIAAATVLAAGVTLDALMGKRMCAPLVRLGGICARWFRKGKYRFPVVAGMLLASYIALAAIPFLSYLASMDVSQDNAPWEHVEEQHVLASAESDVTTDMHFPPFPMAGFRGGMLLLALVLFVRGLVLESQTELRGTPPAQRPVPGMDAGDPAIDGGIGASESVQGRSPAPDGGGEGED